MSGFFRKVPVFFAGGLLILLPAMASLAGTDLLQKYPTSLTVGDLAPEHARSVAFTDADIFRLSHFDFNVGTNLHVETGPADLGIGHCADGAVWAVVIPRHVGTVTSAVKGHENISHVWLRFHPANITGIFPPDTVFDDETTNLGSSMRRIASHKLFSSYHAGDRAMIPEINAMTVDADTTNGQRRFFDVDTKAQTAEYMAAFENHANKPPPAFTPDLGASAFDQIWSSFDKKYAMFVLRPEVDWAQLRVKYRPLALASRSTPEFADVCAEMLRQLRDLHIWMTLGGDPVPVFNRPRGANSNPSAHAAILGKLNHEGQEVQWAVTDDKIGFIAIYGWDDPDIPVQCQQVLEKMRDTRGLIVDVRLNGGGSEDLALQFAGRFLDREFTYASDQYRNGPNHTNLTERFPRNVQPKGPWRYDRPVVLLIGQKCMSSNESFIGMMTGDPQVTTMGDHTCGSSGNPQIITLPLQLTVSVPQWIDYRPDGTPVDEHGFVPQIVFKPVPGAFTGNRDDLLTAALDRLHLLPLPEKPIAGPAFRTDAEMEALDDSRPKVLSVFPVDGAQSVPLNTALRVRFDRPMSPLLLKLNWTSGGILDCDFPTYDAQKYEFTIPVHLAPGMTNKIILNNPYGRTRADFPRDGFQSEDHRLARLFQWQFQTAGLPPGDGAPPKILKISPSPGSQVPYRSTIEIQFDQPMKPPIEVLPRLVKTFDLTEPSLISQVGYDAASHTFRLPMLFLPGKATAFNLTGFCGTNGLAADPVTLSYQVSNKALSAGVREKLNAQEKNPQLLDTLGFMRQQRTNLISLDERVQTLMLYRSKGPYDRLEANDAVFKLERPNRFYVDATDVMGMSTVFAVGSDGTNCWWHSESEYNTNFETCPAGEINEQDISVADPFDLADKTPQQAAAGADLDYLGTGTLNGTACRIIQGWGWDQSAPASMTPIGFEIRWWINAKTGRPLAVELHADDILQRTQFFYDNVNQPVSTENFALPKTAGHSPTLAAPLGEGYTNRFFIVHDGSDGNMLIRYGKQGPKGASSSGYGNFN